MRDNKKPQFKDPSKKQAKIQNTPEIILVSKNKNLFHTPTYIYIDRRLFEKKEKERTKKKENVSIQFNVVKSLLPGWPSLAEKPEVTDVSSSSSSN